MNNSEKSPCPFNPERRGRLHDKQLIDNTAQCLIAGEELTPNIYERDLSPADTLEEMNRLFTLITGATLSGDLVEGEYSLEERLDAYDKLSRLTEEVTSLGNPAFSAAVFTAEIHHLLKDDLLENPQITRPPEPFHIEPNTDSLEQMLALSFYVLDITHSISYERYIHELIPDDAIGAASARWGIGKSQAGAAMLTTALQTFKEDDENYHKAFHMSPRRPRTLLEANIFWTKDLTEMLEVAQAEFNNEWSEVRLNIVRNFSYERGQENYIDQLTQLALGYMSARQQSYTPEEAQTILAASLPQIGNQSHLRFDRMTGAEVRTDLSPDGKSDPRKSLSALLEHTRYVSITEDIQLQYGHLPPREISQCPDPHHRDTEEKQLDGRCPARVNVTCSPEMQKFIDDAKERGCNVGQTAQRPGTAPQVKLATLSALIALEVAEKTRLFQMIEENKIFQNFLSDNEILPNENRE